MKKIISVALAFMMISVCAKAQMLYSKETEEVVTGGVSLKKVQRFYGDYALEINCITVDLNDENLKLKLLKHSGGVDKTDTVINLAKNEQNVVAAINADFFSAYKGDQNFSLGLEVKDGEILQSHINKDMAAGILKNGSLAFSYLDFAGTVAAPDGEKMALAHINKPTDYYGALLAYTADFNGGTSPFLPAGVTVVTVEGEKVTAKGTSLGGTVSVPEDGYILVIDDNMTPFLEHKFSIGDTVEAEVRVAPSIDNADIAFGGGTLLLSDGEKTPITHNVSGNNPRSAIGTNEDGTKIYMITVDGRQSHSRGVTLQELSDICLEMGCTNAMNLDGGGSTAMVGKTLEEKELHFINTPSENRKVINAVAVTSDAKSGETKGFFIKPERENVLAGDSIKLNLTAYDENYNVSEKTTGKLSWSVKKGSGYVRDNVYWAQGSGETEIELYYNGKKTDSCTINVIASVSGIIAPREIVLKEGELFAGEGLAEVFDEKGNNAKVKDITLLNPVTDKDFVTVDKTGIRAKREGGAPLKLSYGNAERSIKVICGRFDADTDAPIIDDSFNTEGSGGFSINVLGAKKPETLFERIVYARAMDIFREADAVAVLGDGEIEAITPGELTPVTGSEWGEYDHGNVKIISLALSDNGKMQRGSQWNNFAKALGDASQKNIIVLLDYAPKFTADIDGESFASILSDAADGKNVFVVYSGDENFCRIEGGVRYISVADARQETMLHRAIQNSAYLSFDVTDDTITYCFKKLYD